MLCIAVFGFGYWGVNIVRNAIQAGCDVKYIIDISERSQAEAKKQYPDSVVCGDFEVALNDSDVEAVAIVLPVSLHYPIAKRSLLAGKHVLVEKPMTAKSDEAEELIAIAREKNLLLMVDHTYLYSSGIRELKNHFVGKEDKIKHFDSTRINLGKYRKDVNVNWDLAPHDLAVLIYLIEENPTRVMAVGASQSGYDLTDLVHMTLFYESGAVANIHVSWTSPEKVRIMKVASAEMFAIFDDLREEDKLRIYKTRFEMNPDTAIVECYSSDPTHSKLDSKETLLVMFEDFVNCIESGGIPVSNSEIGLKVVKILEAADKSLANRGTCVNIPWN